MPLAGCCYRQQLTAAVLVASLRRATTDEYMHWQVDTASSSHDVLASLLRRRNSRVIATVAGWDTDNGGDGGSIAQSRRPWINYAPDGVVL
jgi:GMP synthase-like glutamine amidotransferase